MDQNTLGDQSGSGGRLVLPVGRELTRGLVVAGKTVDTGFSKNQVVLAVLVLAVALQVLADGDSLLDKVVQVLRDLGSKTCMQIKSQYRY